jgi:transposase
MLSRKEKEKLVIQLLEEEKSQREISKIAKVSFTFISNIRKKLEGNNSQPTTRIQSYMMYKDKKEPIEVAITLDIDNVEATKYWNEYLQLKREYKLLKIRNELSSSFLQFFGLFNDMKRNGLTIEEIKKGLDAYLNIEANASYLESLREAISEAENKNDNLTQQTKEKIDIITRLNSEIVAIGKIKNSLILKLRFAQERMRNSFFTNNVYRELPFQLP